LPAIAAILEHLPEKTDVHVFIEVKDKADELHIETRADVHLIWLHRGSTPAKDSQLLEQKLYSFPMPTGKGYAWVAGNTKVVKNIRRHLLNEWHLTKDEMFTMGYW
jgi:NADPH-dependent ferric siderophore reductase